MELFSGPIHCGAQILDTRTGRIGIIQGAGYPFIIADFGFGAAFCPIQNAIPVKTKCSHLLMATGLLSGNAAQVKKLIEAKKARFAAYHTPDGTAFAFMHNRNKHSILCLEDEDGDIAIIYEIGADLRNVYGDASDFRKAFNRILNTQTNN